MKTKLNKRIKEESKALDMLLKTLTLEQTRLFGKYFDASINRRIQEVEEKLSQTP